MNELIKLNNTTIGEQEVNTVNARDLHEFLGVGTRYNDWFSRRVKDYDFLENIDYVRLTQKRVTQTSGGKEGAAVEQVHYITLDMAKELSMVERNDRGKEARRYFIECEKKLREVSLHPTEQLLVNVLRANNDLDRTLAIKGYSDNYVKPLELKVEQQEEEIKELKPKGEFYDAVAQSNSTLSLDQVAKLLNFKNMGRNNLCKYLRDKNIFNHKNVPYQKYIDAGYFKLTESSWRDPYTEELQVSIKTVMYQKGIDWLDRKLRTEGYKRNERPQDFL